MLFVALGVEVDCEVASEDVVAADVVDVVVVLVSGGSVEVTLFGVGVVTLALVLVEAPELVVLDWAAPAVVVEPS